MRSIRRHLTYANVVATLALFIALGGSAYAVTRVGSKEIRNNSVRSVDVRDKTLSGRDITPNKLGGGAIRESTLGKVPAAGNADTVGGLQAGQLKVGCPAGTVALSGVCVEGQASAALGYGAASFACRSRGRQLIPYAVLSEAVEATGAVAPGGEWTSDLSESRTTAGAPTAVVVTSNGGAVTFVDIDTPAQRAFRCFQSPTN